MTFQRKLSPETEKMLVAEYEDGWTVNELTIIYRVSTRTVYRLLSEHGKLRRDRKKRAPRKRSKKKELKPCGTNAAYARHKRKGEYPCTPCLEAHAADVAKYKENKAS